MRAVSRLGLIAYALAAVVIVLDQAAKHWILNVFHLPLRGSWPVAGPLHLTMVWNKGVSFGLLRAEVDLTRWLLVIFSVVVAIFLSAWARTATRSLAAVALGLVIGGAVGNVIDRIRFGAVVDFIDVSRMWFPWIFNIADAAISCGIVLLLIDMLLQDRAAAAANRRRDLRSNARGAGLGIALIRSPFRPGAAIWS